MEGNFKCCKKKECNHYVCVACLSVFHSSCLEKKKSHISLGGYKIYCSEKCQKVDPLDEISKLKQIIQDKNLAIEKAKYEEDEKIDTLNDVIMSLRNEILDKDAHIGRLNKRNADFEDEVLERENIDIQTLKEQRDTILSLNGSITKLKIDIEQYEEELVARAHEILKLENRVKDLDEVSRQMVATIRTMEHENDNYFNEILILRDQINSLVGTKNVSKAPVPRSGKEESKNKEQTVQNRSKPMAPMERKNPNGRKTSRAMEKQISDMQSEETASQKVLILCDQHGRHLGKILHNKKKRLNIETIIKPFALYHDIIKNLPNLLVDYSQNDYVVIIGGTNDLWREKFPQLEHLNKILRSCTQTNILFLSVPYCKNISLNNFIYEYNCELSKHLTRLNNFTECNIMFVDVNNKNGKPMSRFSLSLKILENFERVKKSKFNCPLKFIKISDSIPHRSNINTTRSSADIQPDSNLHNKTTNIDTNFPLSQSMTVCNNSNNSTSSPKNFLSPNQTRTHHT